MIEKQGIDRILVKWTIEEGILISLMLSRSGALNRIGTGDEKGGKMAMGNSEEAFFQTLLEAMPEEWLQNTGRYTLPSPKGKLATLTIALGGENLDTGFEFTYGSQSEGPPEDMVEFVEYAIELTDEWYQEAISKKKKGL